MPRWSRSERARDSLAAAVFAAISLVPALSEYGLVLGGLTQRPSDALHVTLILAQTLPLAARRITPGWALAVVGIAFACDQCLGYPPSPAGLGILFALYSVGAHQRRGRISTAVAACVVYIALATALILLGSRERAWDFATFALVPAAAWGAGYVVRLRAASARVDADRAARKAVTDERDRLARELHDVVSHHVTGVVVQADSASFLLDADESLVREQLASIASNGRRALADLRQLLDVLGPDDTVTSPAIGTLRDLVGGAQRSGQPVELHEEGNPAGSDELRLAVYRIVQEGLTNALKHSAGASTDVAVNWLPGEVQVRLVTQQAGPSPNRPIASDGRGLAGLGERVRRLNGHMSADVDSAGRFVLDATIPIDRGEEPDDGEPAAR
jgi:signal transduction histidine kinase